MTSFKPEMIKDFVTGHDSVVVVLNMDSYQHLWALCNHYLIYASAVLDSETRTAKVFLSEKNLAEIMYHMDGLDSYKPLKEELQKYGDATFWRKNEL